MDRSDQIYREFLAELDGLDRFRQRFQERHPAVPLDREDPDVRRLIESLAYFSIQTRHATMHNLRATWQRLFAGFFDFLLTPMPAAAMAQAVVTDRLVEPVTLGRGTELRLTTEGGAEGSFRTQRDLRVLPIFLESTEVLPRGRSGYRLILRFESRFARRDPIESLSLYVRHLDSYRTSLAVFHALRKSMQDVSVVYDESADETTTGAPCEVSFGSGGGGVGGPDDAAEYQHPLERLRGFFHFPERDLFVHLRVPPSRKPWTRFDLCLDTGPDWTTGRTLHPDFFQLFCVPIVNSSKEMAHPIVADGTASEFAIRSMSAGGDLELHSVTGVFEMSEAGLLPLRPAWLPGTGPSYQIEQSIDDHLTRRHSLLLRMPEAFLEPRKIAVEAIWYQPGFAEDAVGKMEVGTPGRSIDGLQLRLASEVRRHVESTLNEEVNSLVQLLAWRMKSTLTLDEVIALVGYLGIPADSPLARVLPLLRELQVQVAPDSALQGSGLRHVYRVTLEPFDAGMEPLVYTFLAALRELVDCWNAEATVDLKIEVAGAGTLNLFPLLRGAA